MHGGRWWHIYLAYSNASSSCSPNSMALYMPISDLCSSMYISDVLSLHLSTEYIKRCELCMLSRLHGMWSKLWIAGSGKRSCNFSALWKRPTYSWGPCVARLCGVWAIGSGTGCGERPLAAAVWCRSVPAGRADGHFGALRAQPGRSLCSTSSGFSKKINTFQKKSKLFKKNQNFSKKNLNFSKKSKLFKKKTKLFSKS